MRSLNSSLNSSPKAAAMFKEPIAVFTNPADFGEPVQIGGKTVNAVVDREYLADLGYGVATANADPQIIVADADLPDNVRAAEIVVRGQAYTVAETVFDGTGMTVLQLRKVYETPTY